MMNKPIWLLALALCCSMQSQTNNLTGSPYSLFGLGVSSSSNIGINNALGNGGYAIAGSSYINNLNPAAYGKMGEQNFLFDFGFLAEISAIQNRTASENRIAGSFSNIALAASLSSRSAFGLSISPYSDVGYSLIGIESNIEGSFEGFNSSVFGSGGLNDLRVSYGRSVTDNFRGGIYASYLFGVIEEREITDASLSFPGESTLNVLEENYYRGIRFGIGFQYDVLPKLTFGWGVDLTTALSGRRDTTVEKNLDFVPSTVENETNEKIASFQLPTQLNSGIVFRPITGMDLSFDYVLALWNETRQRDNVGVFVDQNQYSVGFQYVADPTSYRYARRIKYRAGFNYNTGYLEVNENPITSYSITAGIGIPLGIRSLSHLNISYGFQRRGDITGILVEERIHTLTVNFSLRDFWFIKRKID